MTTAGQIIAAYPASLPIAPGIVRLAEIHGFDPAYLANVINFESRFNPAALNKKTNAVGLIQFMPKTAARFGTTTEALRQMSAGAQFTYIEQYLRPFKGKLKTQSDVYMAVFYPAYVGLPENTPFPLNVQRANPGIKTPADYTRMANRAAALPSDPGVGSSPLNTNPSSSSPGSEALALQSEKRATRKRRIKLIRGLLFAASGGLLVSSLIYWYTNRQAIGSTKK
jgi:hypothetical protein